MILAGLPTPWPLRPESASTIASRVDALTLVWLAISAFFSLLIFGLILAFGLRYRRRSPDEIGANGPSPNWLEVSWCLVPLAIMLAMFAWGTAVFVRAQSAPAEAVEYHGIAKQWMWKFQHPDGRREIDELHVPVGRPVLLTLVSQDTIHSFFVPAFRVKQDVLPGRYTQVWFEASSAGRYRLLCAEYCGTEHSHMTGTVTAMEPSDYERWLAGVAPSATGASRGEELFTSLACVTCHRPDSTLAPPLEGLFGTRVELADGSVVEADEGYLRESIVNPTAKVVAGYQALMPPYQGRVSEDELFALVDLIRSLAEAP